MRLSIILICLLAIFSCSKEPQLTASNTSKPADFRGVWVNQLSDQLQVVLSIEEDHQAIHMRILGDHVIPLDYKKTDNQALIKFKDENGEVYHLLAQVNDKEEMRMSITSEDVPSFIPIGQLGERVYKLKRLENNSSLITTSASKRKKLN